MGTFSGRHLPVPADGLLLRVRHVVALGLLLPDDRHRLVLWSGEVLRLRGADDRKKAWHVLVPVLEILRTGGHAGQSILLISIIRNLILNNDHPQTFCLYSFFLTNLKNRKM